MNSILEVLRITRMLNEAGYHITKPKRFCGLKYKNMANIYLRKNWKVTTPNVSPIMKLTKAIQSAMVSSFNFLTKGNPTTNLRQAIAA